jgi:hypothetical protein
MYAVRASGNRDIGARVDQKLRRRLHLMQRLHRSFGEREEGARIKILFAKLNEVDAVRGPSAQLILEPLDLRGVYETGCRAIRDCTTEHSTSLAVLLHHGLRLA